MNDVKRYDLAGDEFTDPGEMMAYGNGRFVLYTDHAQALAAERAEREELREQVLNADEQGTAVWNYLQSVSPWPESNDMLWADQIITGIDQLVQRAEQAESALAALREQLSSERHRSLDEVEHQAGLERQWLALRARLLPTGDEP